MVATNISQIDSEAVARATGSTKGAVSVRLRRLKDRIEGSLNAGLAGAPNNSTTATQAASKRTKKIVGSRKRKAPADEDAQDGDANDEPAAGPFQVDGSVDGVTTSRRQTGRKKQKYKANKFLSDDELSLSSFESGETDSLFKPDTNKSENENGTSEVEGIAKPAIKRRKMPAATLIRDRRTPGPVSGRKSYVGSMGIITPPTDEIKQRNTIAKQIVSPTNENEVVSKSPPTTKHSVDSPVLLSEQPLPSIEFSPPSTPFTTISAEKQQSVATKCSDIDIKSLKPGTLLSFAAKGQPQIFSMAIQKPVLNQNRASTANSITSSLPSTATFASIQLKQHTIEHVHQLDIRPEDSISNIGIHGEEDGRTTVKGKRSCRSRALLRVLPTNNILLSRSSIEHLRILQGSCDSARLSS